MRLKGGEKIKSYHLHFYFWFWRYLMKKKIIAFGASNSRNSINQKLAGYAAGLMEGAEITILDLNDFEMPIYSTDREHKNGIPKEARHFKKLIKETDGIIISFAEHNGSYTAAFKNILDWASRVEKDMWQNKPMFLMAASPGKRGAKGVLNLAVNSISFRGGNVISSFSLPFFKQNFSETMGITDAELNRLFLSGLNQFKNFMEVGSDTISAVS